MYFGITFERGISKSLMKIVENFCYHFYLGREVVIWKRIRTPFLNGFLLIQADEYQEGPNMTKVSSGIPSLTFEVKRGVLDG